MTPGADVLYSEGSLEAGQHVSLMGADGPGKAEVAIEELRRAHVFCDDWEQASHGGELRQPWRRVPYARDRHRARSGADRRRRRAAERGRHHTVRLDRARDPRPRDREGRVTEGAPSWTCRRSSSRPPCPAFRCRRVAGGANGRAPITIATRGRRRSHPSRAQRGPSRDRRAGPRGIRRTPRRGRVVRRAHSGVGTVHSGAGVGRRGLLGCDCSRDAQLGRRRRRIPTRILILTPMSVRPDRQRIGVGTRLIRDALGRAEEAGEPAVMVEGIPRTTLASASSGRARLDSSPRIRAPDDAFMVKRLPGYSPDLAGQIVYPAAFDALGY